MTALYRLLAYARPHRARLAGALAAMVLYAAASAYLATLIDPIFDSVLPARERLVSTIVAILVVYVAKGIGAYLSSYLMTDVGQRVVRDLRNVRLPPHPRTVRRVFQHADHRPPDVAADQRCRRRCSVWCPTRSGIWRGNRSRWWAMSPC